MDRELPFRKGNVVQATSPLGTVYNILVVEVIDSNFGPGLRGPYSVVAPAPFVREPFVSRTVGLFPFEDYTMVVLG